MSTIYKLLSRYCNFFAILSEQSKIRSKGEPVNISRGMETLGTPHGYGPPVPLGTRLDQRAQVSHFMPFYASFCEINQDYSNFCFCFITKITCQKIILLGLIETVLCKFLRTKSRFFQIAIFAYKFDFDILDAV